MLGGCKKESSLTIKLKSPLKNSIILFIVYRQRNASQGITDAGYRTRNNKEENEYSINIVPKGINLPPASLICLCRIPTEHLSLSY